MSTTSIIEAILNNPVKFDGEMVIPAELTSEELQAWAEYKNQPFVISDEDCDELPILDFESGRDSNYADNSASYIPWEVKYPNEK